MGGLFREPLSRDDSYQPTRDNPCACYYTYGYVLSQLRRQTNLADTRASIYIYIERRMKPVCCVTDSRAHLRIKAHLMYSGAGLPSLLETLVRSTVRTVIAWLGGLPRGDGRRRRRRGGGVNFYRKLQNPRLANHTPPLRKLEQIRLQCQHRSRSIILVLASLVIVILTFHYSSSQRVYTGADLISCGCGFSPDYLHRVYNRQVSSCGKRPPANCSTRFPNTNSLVS